MTPDELTRKLEQLASRVPREINMTIAEKMEIIGIRFVDDNFVNQSWEGHPWEATQRGGTILVNSGGLKSGFRSARTTGEVKIWNVKKYAKPHNEGFKGKQSVREHTRGVYSGSRTKRKRSGKVTVSAHSRQMNLPRRQFAPTKQSPSPSLNLEIRDTVREHLLNLIKST